MSDIVNDGGSSFYKVKSGEHTLKAKGAEPGLID
jgi:hypothetical protein